MNSQSPASALAKPVSVRMAILGASIGTVMQVYDAVVYGYMAVLISSVLFPPNTTSLFFTFFAFGAGYLAGPVGSIIFGHIADRVGRKTSMLISFWLIGFATLFTGLIPSYATIGFAAPVIVYVLRLLSGAGSSAEWGSVGSYLIELGGKRNRAYYSSYQQFVVVAALLVSSITGTAITTLPHAFQLAYGWRLPFVIGGAILIPIAAVLRWKMPESASFEEVKTKRELVRWPIVKVFTTNWRPTLLTAAGAVIWTVSFGLILTYLPTYLATTTKLSLFDGFVIASIGTFVLMIFIPMWGRIADIWGRKKVALIGSVAFIILPYPFFILMHGGNFWVVLTSVCILDFFIAPLSGTLVAWIGENFPTNDRASAYVPYFITETAFFGFGGAITIALISATGSALSPLYYVTAAGIASTIAYLFMKETVHYDKLPEVESIYDRSAPSVPARTQEANN
jgi:MHS family proline/betaine transporter-like MFS transporter